MSAVPSPAHRYVPGRTERHPEGWFDTLKCDDATALRAGLAYFEAGFYWECHEVLEAIWLRAPNPSDTRDIMQAVIQLANARLKLVMERPKAAARLCDMVGQLLESVPDGAQPLGLDIRDWHAHLHETRLMLQSHRAP